MTEALNKLIENAGWLPISEAEKCEYEEILLFTDTDGFDSIEVGNWQERFQCWSPELRGADAPSKFMPLDTPERMAAVIKHYQAGVDAIISMVAPLAESSGIHGATLEFCQGLQAQAEEIAKRVA